MPGAGDGAGRPAAGDGEQGIPEKRRYAKFLALRVRERERYMWAQLLARICGVFAL